MTSMRLRRIVAITGLAAALSLPAAASAAESKRHIGLHDMTCTSITLAGQTVRTSAKGEFMAKLPARLNKVLSIRLTVSRPDGSKIAFADHVMAKGAAMCNLPFTGPSRVAALLMTGTAAILLGLVLLASGGGYERVLARVRQPRG
jgi:hypothetical protein